MRKIAVLIAVLGTSLLPVLGTVPAHAQATRTWVSGVGDDSNPCSRTAPCLTFAGAISKTAAGGEIDALDPGGFGMLTITKSITIDGGGGQVASMLPSPSLNASGITVSAGATDIVTIRNVRFEGILGNGTGTTGIEFLSGAMLAIDNCKIGGFNEFGIYATTSANAILNVTNTVITNAQTGIVLQSFGGTLNGSIDHTTIQKMSTDGIFAGIGSVFFTVTNSVIVNAAGTGVNAAGAGSVLEVDSSSITNNNTAFATNGGIIRISRNTIYDNNTNFSISGGGTIATGGNNFVAVNGSQAPNGSITQQ
jgi:hypothetical protein